MAELITTPGGDCSFYSCEGFGTTIFAIKVHNAVFIGTDGRISTMPYGNVRSDEVIKIDWITDRVFVASAGHAGSADRVIASVKDAYQKSTSTLTMVDIAQYIQFYSYVELFKQPKKLSLEEYKIAGFILGGLVYNEGVLRLYTIMPLNADGMKIEYIIKEEYETAVDGSGEPNVKGFLEKKENREKLAQLAEFGNEFECVNFVRDVIHDFCTDGRIMVAGISYSAKPTFTTFDPFMLDLTILQNLNKCYGPDPSQAYKPPEIDRFLPNGYQPDAQLEALWIAQIR